MSEHDNEVLKTETAQGESTDWENQKHGFPTEGAFPDSGVKRCLACGSVIAKSGDDELDDEPIVCAVWNVGDILIEYDCTDSEAVAWLRKHQHNLDQAAFNAFWNYTVENCDFEPKDEFAEAIRQGFVLPADCAGRRRRLREALIAKLNTSG